MKPSGGTELLYKNLIKYVGQDWFEKINLVPSFCNPSVIDPSKINVIWQHLSYDQNAIASIVDKNFVDSIDHFVYVSQWQLDQFKNRFPIQDAHNIVIRNAIEPIEFIEKPTNKIKLIYTSMPNRGLDILLDAFEMIDQSNVELTIYSSNIIYGTQYNTMIGNHYDKLFHRCKTMKNVIYKGYAMNTAVRKSLQQSHILAYPSTYEETSCLAAIEAGAAGCKIVTTNLGALSETCGEYASFVEYTRDRQKLVEDYAEKLQFEVNNYHDLCYNIKNQSNWFNNFYSWEKRSKEWIHFLGDICEK